MILELATINIRPGTNTDFEISLEKAQQVICRSKGYISLQFYQCIEEANRYSLFIRWQTLEDHTVGFRESELFKEWRAIIGPFFEIPPVVQHYELKLER